MKIGDSSWSPLVDLLFLRRLSCFLAYIQTVGSVLTGSLRLLLAPLPPHFTTVSKTLGTNSPAPAVHVKELN